MASSRYTGPGVPVVASRERARHVLGDAVEVVHAPGPLADRPHHLELVEHLHLAAVGTA